MYITPTHGGCHGTHPCPALVTPRTESDYVRKCSSCPDTSPAKDLCDDLNRHIKWERCRVVSQKETPSELRPSFFAPGADSAALMSPIHLGLLLLWGQEAKVTSSIVMYVPLLRCISLCHPCFGSRPEVCHGSGYADSPCIFDTRVMSNATHFGAEKRTSLEHGNVRRRCLTDWHLPRLVAVICISKSFVGFRLPDNAHSCLAFASNSAPSYASKH